MLLCSYVPSGFRYSYIVPIPKPKECYSKALTCDDFRGIAISPIVSNVFEHCTVNKLESFYNLIASLGLRKDVDVHVAMQFVQLDWSLTT